MTEPQLAGVFAILVTLGAASAAAADALPQQLEYTEVVLHSGPEARLPLVVVIHGLGDEPERFVVVFEELGVPVRLIAPRAPIARRGGGSSWFPGLPADPDLSPMVEGARTSVAALAGLIARLTRERPTCGRPVVTGFSQGGLLTLALAVHHPGVVGAAIPVAGWLPSALRPAQLERSTRYPRVQALHGTADKLLPLGPTREANKHLRALGLDIDTRTYKGVGHNLSTAMRQDLLATIRAEVARVPTCD